MKPSFWAIFNFYIPYLQSAVGSVLIYAGEEKKINQKKQK